MKTAGAEFMEQSGHSKQKDKLFHQKLAETCYLSAVESLGEGDSEDALDKLDDALSCQPDYLPALLGRAELYLDFDDPDAAEPDIKRIMKLDPDSSASLLLIGNFYRAKNNFSKAVECYSRALKKNEKDHIAFYARAVSYDMMNETEKALADFEQCLKLAPLFVSGWYDRGVLYACANNWPAAIADYSKVIELDPEFVHAYVTRGDARALSGDCKGAEQDFQKAIDLDPEDGMAYYYRAAMYDSLGEDEKASIDFQMAAEKNFDPED